MIFITILNNEEPTYIGNKSKKIDREKQQDFRVPLANLLKWKLLTFPSLKSPPLKPYFNTPTNRMLFQKTSTKQMPHSFSRLLSFLTLRTNQTRLNWSSFLSLFVELKFANPWNSWARGFYRPKVHGWWKPLVSTWLLGQRLCDLLHLARKGRCAKKGQQRLAVGRGSREAAMLLWSAGN